MSIGEGEKVVRALVVYASRHGATQGIAERIAATFRQAGLDTTVQPAEDADNPTNYEAVIIGSAVYEFHWMKEAAGYVRHNHAQLAERPVWLFSSGPLGTSATDAQGRDQRVTAAPKEMAEFEAAIHPRDHRVFFGAHDPDSKPVGIIERVMHMLPAARGSLPAGDFRDWAEIDAWATDIARALTPVPAAQQ